jgi:hypothetical protein
MAEEELKAAAWTSRFPERWPHAPADLRILVEPRVHMGKCSECGEKVARESIHVSVVLPTGRVLSLEYMARLKEASVSGGRVRVVHPGAALGESLALAMRVFDEVDDDR